MKKSKTKSTTESESGKFRIPQIPHPSEMVCRAPHLSEMDIRIFEEMRIEDEQDEDFVDEPLEPMMDWEREAMDLMIRGDF